MVIATIIGVRSRIAAGLLVGSVTAPDARVRSPTTAEDGPSDQDEQSDPGVPSPKQRFARRESPMFAKSHRAGDLIGCKRRKALIVAAVGHDRVSPCVIGIYSEPHDTSCALLPSAPADERIRNNWSGLIADRPGLGGIHADLG